MSGTESALPVNGDTLTLVADGGNWGLVVECNFCNGSGTDPEPMCCGEPSRAGGCCGQGIQQRCRECSGSGDLFHQWHSMMPWCRANDPNRPVPQEASDDIAF